MAHPDDSRQGPGGSALSPEEQDRILEVLEELRAEPPPTNPRPYGCLGALLALVLLFSMPRIGPAIGVEGTLATVIGGVLLLLLLVAGFLGVFGGGFVSGHVIGQVEEALELLATQGPALPQDALRRTTVRILWDATVSVGPTTSSTYDQEDAAVRIQAVMPYVQDVERFLVSREQIYPVFTR